MELNYLHSVKTNTVQFIKPSISSLAKANPVTLMSTPQAK